MSGPNIVSDNRRAAAQKHASRIAICLCGKACRGNGGWSSHKKACKAFQEARARRRLADEPAC